MLSLYPRTRIKFRASSSRNRTSHLPEKCFKIIWSPYEVQKSRNLLRCHVISCVGYGKKLRMFRASCDVRCIKPRHRNLWRCLGFTHRTSQLARNILNFLPQPTHAITWHLDKFRDFRTSYGLYIILKHFFGKWLVMLREEDARNLMRVRG